MLGPWTDRKCSIVKERKKWETNCIKEVDEVWQTDSGKLSRFTGRYRALSNVTGGEKAKVRLTRVEGHVYTGKESGGHR